MTILIARILLCRILDIVLMPIANNFEQIVKLAPCASLKRVHETQKTTGIAKCYCIFCLTMCGENISASLNTAAFVRRKCYTQRSSLYWSMTKHVNQAIERGLIQNPKSSDNKNWKFIKLKQCKLANVVTCMSNMVSSHLSAVLNTSWSLASRTGSHKAS